MNINQNIAAMNAHRHVFNTNKGLDRTLERLSSGLRINSGADDASGLAIAEKMNAQIAGISSAHQNAQDGQALFKIAEGALAQVTKMLTRMEELAVRATNGTLTDSDRTSLMDEVKELRDQINVISKTTEYNSLKLLNGSLSVTTTVNVDNVAVLNKPKGIRTGEVTFNLTTKASAAVVTGTTVTDTNVLTSGVTSSGIININGSDIAINTGDTLGAIVGKINAVNDQTNVVATLDSDKTAIILTSGILDEDAKHITTSNLLKLQNDTSPIVGYALEGEKYSINIAGGGTVLGLIGLSAQNVKGSDAAGSINGVAMKANGTILENTEFASVAFGLKVDTGTYLNGNGSYIRNYTDSDSHITSKGADGNTATIKINVEKTLQLQIGANYNQSTFVGLESVATNMLGIGGSSKYLSLEDIKLDSVQNSNFALKTIQKAIDDVAAMRSRLGANMNRLDYTVATLAIQRENVSAAQSRIQDADISMEMTNFTKQQIMLQAGTAMLAQANARPQTVLSLLG